MPILLQPSFMGKIIFTPEEILMPDTVSILNGRVSLCNPLLRWCYTCSVKHIACEMKDTAALWGNSAQDHLVVKSANAPTLVHVAALNTFCFSMVVVV